MPSDSRRNILSLSSHYDSEGLVAGSCREVPTLHIPSNAIGSPFHDALSAIVVPVDLLPEAELPIIRRPPRSRGDVEERESLGSEQHEHHPHIHGWEGEAEDHDDPPHHVHGLEVVETQLEPAEQEAEAPTRR